LDIVDSIISSFWDSSGKQENCSPEDYFPHFQQIIDHAIRLNIADEIIGALEWGTLVNCEKEPDLLLLTRQKKHIRPIPTWLAQRANYDPILPRTIGTIYEGLKCPNFKEACHWYKRAYHNGCANVELDIAHAYEEQGNFYKANKWHVKGFRNGNEWTFDDLINSANEGNTFANLTLTMLYDCALDEKERNDIEMLNQRAKTAAHALDGLYHAVIEDNDADAQFRLGIIYAFGLGEKLGIGKNENIALECFSYAATQKHEEALNYLKNRAIEGKSSKALVLLSKIYSEGLGCAPKGCKEGFDLFREAPSEVWKEDEKIGTLISAPDNFNDEEQANIKQSPLVCSPTQKTQNTY
jgi:TPR repeat protein